MKNLTEALLGHYAGERTTLATCWKATLTNGTVVTATSLDRDIVFGGLTYKSAQSYSASNIESSSELNPDNLEVEGFLAWPAITDEDIHSGLWDYAEIEVFEVNYTNLSQGRNILRVGTLGEVRGGRSKFTAEFRGLLQAYTRTIVRLVTKECTADLGDSRCKVDLAAITVTGIVGLVLENRIIISQGAFQADDWYTGGKLTWTSGANNGRSMEIKRNTVGRIELSHAMYKPIALGDTYTIYPGCQKRFNEDCISKFANGLNFRGFPDLPGSKIYRQGGIDYGDTVLSGSGGTGTGGSGGGGSSGGTGDGGVPLPAASPVLTLAFGTQNGATKATGTVTTDQPTGFLYALFSANQVETPLNVRFGQSQPVNSAGVQSVTVTGLAPNTAYYPHFLHINGNKLESTVVTGAPFTTDLTDPYIGTEDSIYDLPDEGSTGSTGMGGVNTLLAAKFEWGDVYYKTVADTYTLDPAQGTISHITERRIYTLNMNPVTKMPYAVGDFVTIMAQPLTKTWTVDGNQMRVTLDEPGWTADMNLSAYVYFHRIARVVPNSFTFEVWNIRPLSSSAELARLMAMPTAWDIPPTGGIANVWRDTYNNYTSHIDPRPRSYNGVLAPTQASPWPGSPRVYGIDADLMNKSVYATRYFDVLLGDVWYKKPSGEWTTDASQGTVSHVTLRKRFRSWATLLRPSDMIVITAIPQSRDLTLAPYKEWVAPDGSIKRFTYIEDNLWANYTTTPPSNIDQLVFEHIVRVVEDDYFEIWGALPLASEAELQAYLAMPVGWTSNPTGMETELEFGIGARDYTYNNPYPLSYNGVIVPAGPNRMTHTYGT